MDAPYNNPQTLVFARMKHNTCVMRLRSLHRRLLARQTSDTLMVGGSCGVGQLPPIDEPRHSRQNSRDSNRSHRVTPPIGKSIASATSAAPSSTSESAPSTPSSSVGKNIEIYATLPKKKGKKAAELLSREDGDYRLPSESERSGRQTTKATVSSGFPTMRRERAKSEERKSKPVPIPTSPVNIRPEEEVIVSGDASSDNSSKSPGKKQHRIRRRLLMGGLIKRKNRSLPDLRADEEAIGPAGSAVSVEETPQQPAVADYPPEDASNPNLEKSKLMRRSFHASLGKNLHATKVPPPPPVRKTSQLTPHNGSATEAEYLNLPINNYADSQITVRADVHHERTPSDNIRPVSYAHLKAQFSAPEVPSPVQSDLPPYPTMESVIPVHSRQHSDEFPPPPPPQELQMLEGCVEAAPLDQPPTETAEQPEPSGLLAALQRKRSEILGSSNAATPSPPPLVAASASSDGNRWLQELQAKQATLQNKKTSAQSKNPADSSTNKQQEDNNKSVRDLASRFEKIGVNPVKSEFSYDTVDLARPQTTQQTIPPHYQQPSNVFPAEAAQKQTTPYSAYPQQQQPMYPQQHPPFIQQQPKLAQIPAASPPQQLEEQPSTPVIPTAPAAPVGILDDGKKKKTKKNVTFCDQVILVATAEEEQEESYVPNPILQRVLRSAFQQELVKERYETLKGCPGDPTPSNPVQPEPSSAPVPSSIPNFNNCGSDEVDRPSGRYPPSGPERSIPEHGAKVIPPYQKLPVNSKMFQGYNIPPNGTLPANGSGPMTNGYSGQYPVNGRPNYPMNGHGSVPPSPMMGQGGRMANGRPNGMAPPSYAPPPQYNPAQRSAQPPTARYPPNPYTTYPGQHSAQPPQQQPQQHTLRPYSGQDMTLPQQKAAPSPALNGHRWMPPTGEPNCRTSVLNPCGLCGKKQVPSQCQYCSDCSFYMQRFKPKA